MTRVWYRQLLPGRIWEDPPALRSFLDTTLRELPTLTGRPGTIVVGAPELRWAAYRLPVFDGEGQCVEMEQSAPQDMSAPLPEWAQAVLLYVLADLVPLVEP